jgi:hypothetical protein
MATPPEAVMIIWPDDGSAPVVVPEGGLIPVPGVGYIYRLAAIAVGKLSDELIPGVPLPAFLSEEPDQ